MKVDPPRSWWLPNKSPQMILSKHKNIKESSLLEPRPLMCWSGPENIAWVKINDEGSWALLDSGSTINAVTPEFIKACSLDVGPLSDLVNGTLKINGFRGLFS